jgi:hypothetical protein
MGRKVKKVFLDMVDKGNWGQATILNISEGSQRSDRAIKTMKSPLNLLKDAMARIYVGTGQVQKQNKK